MKLNPKIDKDIQRSLNKAMIKFPTDSNGNILITEYRMDIKAKAGTLYIKPPLLVPGGELPFLVVNAQWIYGVFHLNNQALMIEVGSDAIDGDIKDYYGQFA